MKTFFFLISFCLSGVSSLFAQVNTKNYAFIGELHNGLAGAKWNDKWGYVDKDLNEIIPCQYESWDNFKNGLATVQVGGRQGVIDTKGNIVIPFKYDEVWINRAGITFKMNNKHGLLDRNGVEVIPAIYTYLVPDQENRIHVCLDNKYGYVDNRGNELIPIKYESLGLFYDGLAYAKMNGKYGFINEKGEVMIPFQYEDAHDFEDGLAAVRLDWKYGFINQKGKLILSHLYSYTYDFSEGIAKVTRDGYNYYIDKKGVQINHDHYQDGFSFWDGMAAVKSNDKWGFIDKKGKTAINFKYIGNGLLSYPYFSEGLAGVKITDKWGFIDKNDKEIIPFIYETANSFSEGLASVQLNGKWFFIDKKGKSMNGQFSGAITTAQGEKVDFLSVFKIFAAMKSQSIRGNLITCKDENGILDKIRQKTCWQSAISLPGQVEATVMHEYYTKLGTSSDQAEFIFLKTDSEKDAKKRFIQLKEQINKTLPVDWFVEEKGKKFRDGFLSFEAKSKDELQTLTVEISTLDKGYKYVVRINVFD